TPMQLATVRYRERDLVAVRVNEEVLVDVRELQQLGGVAAAQPAALHGMLDVIRAGSEWLQAIDAALDRVRVGERSVELIPVHDVTWHPPVRPGKICAVAMN